jgi:NADH:ubiquinone oxidoreductase subunit F (NADH-binding)
MEIVEEWLDSNSCHECTPIHTSILTGKKHVEELLEGHKVQAR